ncbi:hypothetical protein EVAR_91612_1 [Eumeta japonica]|uniref:Uncharacterized protein n=1 Tax=Eumeta variegata TaxID=151549 RepID=A0A4C1UWL1_EUMVA|nr:hypothetical protein EVAR_91612_1 [Eumeta japonica]
MPVDPVVRVVDLALLPSHTGDKESQIFLKNKILKRESEIRKESSETVLQNVTNIVGKASPKDVSPTKEEYKNLLAESERQLLELKSKVTDTDKSKCSDSKPVTLTTPESNAMLTDVSLLDSSLELQTSSEDSMTKSTVGRPKDMLIIRETTDKSKDKGGSNDGGHGLNTSEKTDLPKPKTESDQLFECVLKEAKSKGWKKRDKNTAETRVFEE